MAQLVKLLLIFIICILSFKTVDAVITSNIKDYWGLENFTESTIYSDLGLNNLTNKSTTNVSGQIGSARYFPGGNYLVTPFNLSGAYTIDLWFNATSGVTGDTNRRVVSTQNESLASAVNGIVLAYHVVNDLLRVYHQNNGWASCGNFSSVENVPLQHITVSWNTTHILCYLNGSLKTTVAYTQVYTDSGTLMIGSNWPSVNNFLNKSIIDEIKIWNRSLSEAEVLSLHTNETSGNRYPYPEPAISACSYTSGNFNINISDNCNITSIYNLNRNNVTIYGSGNNIDRLNLTEGSIINFSQVLWVGINTTIWGKIG